MARETEKVQVLTLSVLTGIRAAVIHRNLTCATLSRNINILQDSEFMSANKMKRKPNYLRKKTVRNQKHKSSTQAGDMRKLNR